MCLWVQSWSSVSCECGCWESNPSPLQELCTLNHRAISPTLELFLMLSVCFKIICGSMLHLYEREVQYLCDIPTHNFKNSRSQSHSLCQCSLADWSASFSGKPCIPWIKYLSIDHKRGLEPVIIVYSPWMSVLMMALVWSSNGRNEVTRSECKGKAQQFP